ncbi:MAG TPA: hypothetical protein DCS24_06490 [Erythrobacter sp.]|nr:hypothetical protein [Erythrobacter sp.]
MDTLRGNFGSSEFPEDSVDFDLGEDESIRDLPPAAIGQDERRMQVRAYNHWAGMLGDRKFPAVEELEPQNLEDFGPYSVLLDFSLGIEDPAIQFLGDKLAAECGADYEIRKLSDVPSRSLLSRITDHYMQILANQAPIGFEAEFINQRDVTILYRGILLPFSSDNETIDFIHGVINWKEMADAAKADELLFEIDQALEAAEESTADSDVDDDDDEPLTLTEIAPANDEAGEGDVFAEDAESGFDAPEAWSEENVPSIEPAQDRLKDDEKYRLPTPEFGDYDLGDEEEEENEANYSFASLTDHVDLPTGKSKALDLDELGAQQALNEAEYEVSYDDGSFDEGSFDEPYEAERKPLLEPVDSYEPELSENAAVLDELPEDAGLYDFLASARELAHVANDSEDRSRAALYVAVGRAFDVALAAESSPEEYEELLIENGLVAQKRAPMTPIVKLVFGADYDKTRLTEYATVLGYARRIGLEQSQLANYLSEAEGGLKGLVQAERRLRRKEAGEVVDPVDEVRSALAKKLRELEPQEFSDIDPDGGEFGLVMIHRTEDGEIVMLGEIEQDIPLIERAARKLLG